MKDCLEGVHANPLAVPVIEPLWVPRRRLTERSRTPSARRTLSSVAALATAAAVGVPVPVYSAVRAVPVPSVTGSVPGDPGLLRYSVTAALTTPAVPSAFRIRPLCRTRAIAGTPMAMMAEMTARTARISIRVNAPLVLRAAELRDGTGVWRLFMVFMGAYYGKGRGLPFWGLLLDGGVDFLDGGQADGGLANAVLEEGARARWPQRGSKRLGGRPLRDQAFKAGERTDFDYGRPSVESPATADRTLLSGHRGIELLLVDSDALLVQEAAVAGAQQVVLGMRPPALDARGGRGAGR